MHEKTIRLEITNYIVKNFVLSKLLIELIVDQVDGSLVKVAFNY